MRAGLVQGGRVVRAERPPPRPKRPIARDDLQAMVSIAAPPVLSGAPARAIRELELAHVERRLLAAFGDPLVLARAEQWIARAEPQARRPLLPALSATFGRRSRSTRCAKKSMDFRARKSCLRSENRGSRRETKVWVSIISRPRSPK